MHERIVVAALPTLCAALLPPAISKFRKSHPNVSIQMRDVLTDEIITRVRSGDAHIGLGAFLGYGDDLAVWPLFRDRLVAVVPSGLLDPQTHTLTWQVLAAHPLILMGKDSNIRKLTDLAILRHRLTGRPAFEVELIATAVALVHAGLGVAIVPSLEAELVRSRKVKIVALSGEPLWRETGVLTRRNVMASTLLDEFIALLRLQGERIGV